MLVLGIETSCDETAAAVVANGREILSNVIASQVKTHAPFGGVVPELASREHLQNIGFIVEEAFKRASVRVADLDGIAVTRGPGLMGALLVGVCYGKAMAYSSGKKIVGVNHIEGHLVSPFIENPDIEFPVLSLVASGGHTLLYWSTRPAEYRRVGRTRDDAAGEALDKLAKLLGLGYPGGPIIDRLARRGDANRFSFSIPQTKGNRLDFSFSGLKTAALRLAAKEGLKPLQPLSAQTAIPQVIVDLCASFQRAVVDILLDRTRKAAELHAPASILLSGGVSCNSLLRDVFQRYFVQQGLRVYVPSPILTTDNAAMIAAAGTARLLRGESDSWELIADPNLEVATVDDV